MFDKVQFGQRLLAVRKQNHETQERLGQAIGLAKGRISDMEKGRNTTTIDKVVMICEHYGVSADYLLGLTDEP